MGRKELPITDPRNLMKIHPNNLVLLTLTSAALLLSPFAAEATSFTTVGSLATARQNHTATLLPNGKVLVAGGLGSSTATNRAELYDPATGKWTDTGPLVTARYYHTATLLLNGLVLVTGGR